jgi:hypothetical protein
MDFLETAKNLETAHGHGTITYLDFNLDSSTSDKDYPHLKLMTKTKHIELHTYQVKSRIDEEIIADLKIFHAVDGEAMVRSVLESESLLQRQKKLLDVYSVLSDATEKEIMTEWKKTLKKIFPKIRYKTYLINDSIEGSRLLISSILSRSNLIAARSRRGPGNFIICNGQVGALIQDLPSFVYFENTVYSNTSDKIRAIGSIAGNIEVFINPFQRFTDNVIIVGRKTQENEPGVYIVENKGSKEIMETAMWEESKMIKSKSLRERLAFVDTENASKNFVKFEVEFTKKPLWRRMLFI